MQLNYNRIDLELARRQLPVSEFCKLAGIAYPSFAQIRSGKVTPRPVTVGNIAAALGLDPAELIEQEAVQI